jgi:hypothetical protein
MESAVHNAGISPDNVKTTPHGFHRSNMVNPAGQVTYGVVLLNAEHAQRDEKYN